METPDYNSNQFKKKTKKTFIQKNKILLTFTAIIILLILLILFIVNHSNQD